MMISAARIPQGMNGIHKNKTSRLLNTVGIGWYSELRSFSLAEYHELDLVFRIKRFLAA